MALFLWRSHAIFLTFASTVVLYLLFTKVLRPGQMVERDTRDTVDSAAEHIDPAAMDLTPLVNTLINSSQSGSRQLFSLLSVTSYSSLALHKLTLLVYNISNIRNIESQMFRRRFCYCVTNETNDLTDFAAILLDVMENSTSYLHELFKSASIVSVSQRNNSECIYICVMAGKMGRKMPELWDGESISPLFNKTIVEGPHRVANISSLRLPIGWHQLPTNLSLISPSGISSMLGSRVQSTAYGTPTPMAKTAAAMAQTSVIQPLASANPSNVTPQRSRLQDTSEAGATVSRTSEVGATVSRTTEAGATVSRTTEAGATVSRTSEAGATVSRTSEAGATVSRTSEAGATVSRTSEAGATVSRTTEAGATVSRTSEAGATVSRTSEAGVTVSRTSEAGATVSRTSEAGATVSRTSEAGATVSRTSEAGAFVFRTSEPGATVSRTSEATVSRTSEAGATVSSTTEAGATVSRTSEATVSRTSEAGATVSRTSEVGATVSRTSEAGATVSRTTEAGATVSRTTEAGATVSRTSEVGATVSRTSEPGATVSRTSEVGATVSRTSEAGATVSRTSEAGAVTPPLGPALGPTTGPSPSAAAQPKTKPYSTPSVTAEPIVKHLVTSSPLPTTTSTPKLTTKHTTATRTTVDHSWRTTGPIMPLETEKAGCPWKRPESTSHSIFSGSVTTVGAHKLQPCLFELCKFFSQCLCRPFSHQTRMNRYCNGSHVWYEKHTFEVCRRVRRISFSRNLKQRCLMKMCNNL